MKNWVKIIMTISLCAFLTSDPFFAHAGGMNSPDLVIPKKFIGEITGIDLQAKFISARQSDVSFGSSFDDKTVIRKGQDILTIKDVKTGQKVIIRYVEMNGMNVAKSIFIYP